MALFNKLNDLAKNIGDLTNDAIETNKMASKMNAEHNLANDELKKLGEYYYNIFISGGELPPEAQEMCLAVKAHYDAIDAAQAEIDKIKAANEAKQAAAQAAPAVAPAAPAAPAGGITCPGCSTVNAAGVKFCQNCGTKLEVAPPEPAAPQVPTETVCPSCGTVNGEGVKFCQNCGTKLAADEPIA